MTSTNKSADNFWTDEMVAEFGRTITSYVDIEHWKKEVENFKASKQKTRFDEITEKNYQPTFANNTERIEVDVRFGLAGGMVASLEVRLSKFISLLKCEQYTGAIQAAIEAILNDEKLVARGSISMSSDRKFDTKESCWIKYTEEDLRKAFTAAKEKYIGNPIGEIHYYDKDVVPFFPERFKTFEDYKKQTNGTR